jgi:hypothetical protein
LTIFANTTQRELQFVTRIQLSKNKRTPSVPPLPKGEGRVRVATNPERLVNGAS